MQIHIETEVRPIVMENPATSRVFEHFGIDYDCEDGRKSLAEACEERLLLVEQVLEKLNKLTTSASTSEKDQAFTFDPQITPLANIIQHIVFRYHATARRDTTRIRTLAQMVIRRHGTSNPELKEVGRVFRNLSEALEHYMHKEEWALFPAITGQHQALREDSSTSYPDKRVARPIHVIETEHQDCEDMLQDLRRLTSGYVTPENVCPTFRVLYHDLEQFESDTREHIYLEDTFLFPRAITEGSLVRVR